MCVKRHRRIVMSDEIREITEMLREHIPQAVPKVHRALLKMAFQGVEPTLETKIGPKTNRIWVFGPYPNGGREILQKVAKKVAKFGYSALTGFGFYSEGKPEKFYPLSAVLPPPVLSVIKIIPSYTYLHELPLLGAMAVFYQNQERAQVHELIGCYDYRIPSFGFIIHPKIRQSNNSAYLADHGTWVECSAYDKSLCGHLIFPERFCPFFDSVRMPWTSLQLFLEKNNRMVAVTELKHIDKPLESFLRLSGQLIGMTPPSL
jgi:hypothetical protein